MPLSAKGLCCAGFSGTAQTTTDTLDPATDTWTNVTAITGARDSAASFCTEFLTGATMAVLGGVLQKTSAEEFTHSGATWSSLTAIPSGGRQWAAAENLATDGWLLTGYISALTTDIQKYDVTGNSWANDGTVNTGRYQLASFADPWTMLKAFTVGGWTTVAVNVVEEFNSVGSTSTTMTVLPRTARFNSGASAGAENAGYNFGAAVAPNDDMHRYDIDADTWAAETSCLATTRQYSSGHAVGNGLYSAADVGASSDSEKFNESTGTWVAIGDLTTNRYGPSGAGSPNSVTIPQTTVLGFYAIGDGSWTQFSAAAVETGSEYGAGVLLDGQRTIYWRPATDIPGVQSANVQIKLARY